MKRYFCTVATGLLLALVGTSTATAGLPLPGNTQEGTQSTSFGDQTVGEQKNDADVNQAQGNGNINISPAISIGGDAETRNSQGNGNVAVADVDQSNKVNQSQGSTQSQRLEQNDNNGCCGGQSQTGEQSASFGDQTVGEQKNDADVNQAQGNGNINISPAISIGGDAETRNSQGNGNVAVADVDQSNRANQSQSASQSQNLRQGGGGCCKSHHGSQPAWDCKPPHGQLQAHSRTKPCRYDDRPDKGGCCGGQTQSGDQSASFGDQTVGEQKNDADVNQAQGNKNANGSPAIGVGGKKSHSPKGGCGCRNNSGDDAKTWNSQGNSNVAGADIDQGNRVDQSQGAWQSQSLVQNGGALSLS